MSAEDDVCLTASSSSSGANNPESGSSRSKSVVEPSRETRNFVMETSSGKKSNPFQKFLNPIGTVLPPSLLPTFWTQVLVKVIKVCNLKQHYIGIYVVYPWILHKSPQISTKLHKPQHYHNYWSGKSGLFWSTISVRTSIWARSFTYLRVKTEL